MPARLTGLTIESVQICTSHSFGEVWLVNYLLSIRIARYGDLGLYIEMSQGDPCPREMFFASFM